MRVNGNQQDSATDQRHKIVEQSPPDVRRAATNKSALPASIMAPGQQRLHQ